MANKPPDSRRNQDPNAVGADGWPAWMGAADSSLAPKPPPKPRTVKQQPAIVARKAAPPPQPAAVAPAPAPPKALPRRGWRSLICGFLIVIALIGGELAAQFRPEPALRLQQAVGAVPWAIVGGVAFVLFAILVWQAGRPRRPLFLPLAVVLCLASAAAGLHRGGHDIDLERTATRVRTLETELGNIQKKLDRTNGSLQKSSLAIQERDQSLDALRKEIEELKKKLAEKQ
jgi:hypothetical protein